MQRTYEPHGSDDSERVNPQVMASQPRRTGFACHVPHLHLISRSPSCWLPASALRLRWRSRLSGKSHALTTTLLGDLAGPADQRQTTPGHDRTELGAGLELGLGRRFNVGLAFRHGFGGGIASEQHVLFSVGIGF